LQEDYDQQRKDILAAFSRAKDEAAAVDAATHKHFQSAAAEALLAFETAKAEAQERDSEEYNVLKLSLKVQVPHVVHQVECGMGVPP
jgi:hypothetical protein